MKAVVLLSALFCTPLGAIRKAPLSALAQAKAEIDLFIKNSSKQSCQEYNILVRHLTYYRTWGGYQQGAAYPSFELERNLTPAIEQVEEKIKAIVAAEPQLFRDIASTQRASDSTLSPKGEDFFAELIDYAQKQPCPPQEQQTKPRK